MEMATDGRSAFTWRRTAQQKLDHDEVLLRLRRDLATTRLDLAEVLTDLMDLASTSPVVYAALLTRLAEHAAAGGK